MRTTPIVTIIRKYGLTSKRLNPKNRIKYEDAIKSLEAYQNSSLKIGKVLDNTRQKTHNNCHCGIPGCGQRIRYEYLLVPKNDENGPELVAGSTCVWPTLGLSEVQRKDFLKADTIIRDHYALLDWKDNNPEVLERLEKLRENNVVQYKAFWEEIEFAPLLDEDKEYILKLDIQGEIAKVKYQEYLNNVSREEYDKAVSYVPELRDYYKDNFFAQNLCFRAERRLKLSGNQFRWLKVLINRMWFDKNIKGTSKDMSSTCDTILKDMFDFVGYTGDVDLEKIHKLSKMIKNECPEVQYAWMAYKCKNAIV